MNILRLPPALRAQLEREARAAFPRECCGLIEGKRSGDVITARALHATRNVAREADRFEIDPADQFRILRAARVNGAEVVGCYHSHPNGTATPSLRDREGADEEGFVWLIATLTARSNQDLAAFILKSNQLEPIAVEPT